MLVDPLLSSVGSQTLYESVLGKSLTPDTVLKIF